MEKEKKKNCRPLAAERSAAAIILSFVVPVLGSSYLSARKILSLGSS